VRDELDGLGHPDKLLLLARLRRHDGDALGAHEAVGRALDGNPVFAEALVFQGRLFTDEQRYASALGSLLRAVTANPTCVGAHFALGELFERLELLEFARRSYPMVLQQYGGHGPSHERLLSLFEPLTMLRRQIRNSGEAAALHPAFGDIRFNRARALYQLGEFEAALADLAVAGAGGFDARRVYALEQQIRTFAGLLAGTFVPAEEPTVPALRLVA